VGRGGGPGARTGTGTVTAYRGSTAIYTRTIAGAGFLNDVVVTERAVYFTDSFRAALVVVPLGADGAPAGEPFLRSLAASTSSRPASAPTASASSPPATWSWSAAASSTPSTR
jgi:hypothetical protein